LVVTFSEDMNPEEASNPANYTVLVPARGTDRPVQISRAFYDSHTHQATLRVAEKIYLFRPWRLVIRDNVTDLGGNAIDASGDGVAGRDFVIKMSRRSEVGPASHAPEAVQVGVKVVPAGPLSVRAKTVYVACNRQPTKPKTTFRTRQAANAMNAANDRAPKVAVKTKVLSIVPADPSLRPSGSR
jgi:hypothetical protein